jgi:small-conductance mechanosensitive channel
MADENTNLDETGVENEPDYKTLYEEMKKHARGWEKKAKANKDAATALDEASTAKKTAEEQIAELTRRLDEKESAEKRLKIAAKVAQ